MPAARLFEDSEHFAGVRDYEPGDPMHHVHWRLSAHAGRLQTKTYEPTRSAEVLFALDLSDGEPFWERADAGDRRGDDRDGELPRPAGDPRRLARGAGRQHAPASRARPAPGLRRGVGGPGVRPVHGARADAEPAHGRPRAHPA